MVVKFDNRLESLLRPYDVNRADEDRNDLAYFIEITDTREPQLTFTVQFAKNKIYCVYFFNNQYFEVEEDWLYEVVQSILRGGYYVQERGFFKKTPYIVIKTDRGDLSPERVGKVNNTDEYSLLPRGFSKIRQS